MASRALKENSGIVRDLAGSEALLWIFASELI